ncbi:MAG: Multifunctional non-homologous end joining protein LigD [Phycisphaerae bacterium]|nr:Multifunctional non-homologous end joining protein LigD [Phycisphaerae bacterium]
MAKPPGDKLADYQKKRDFARTPEPTGGQASPDAPIFVVQKHDASRLHYDFRLEIGGTLASWAVPKGPSLDTSQKRLAVHVEDHPLDYADFEGTIPADEYGGGTVMLWDRGTVRFLGDQPPEAMLEGGFLEFVLSGQKLKGRFKLIQTKMGGQAKNWLLVKGGDEHANKGDVLVEQPDSVKTGRSLEQIAAEAQET